MTINWPIIIFIFCLSIPGVVIAVKRLIYFLLPNNSEDLKKRLSRFAIFQTLFMVLILSFAGSILAPITGLQDRVLEGLLQGTAGIHEFTPILLPAILYAVIGLIIFLILYYKVFARIIDSKCLEMMTAIRTALGIDGCVLYGGVVEEVLARWGLLNLTVFFGLLFTKNHFNLIIYISIFTSGVLFAIGQLPAYIAAGCTSNRRFVYSFMLLSLYQSLLFGYLFWRYGLIAAILSHMLFHIIWAIYEYVKKS